MSTVWKRPSSVSVGNDQVTYFAYLSRNGHLPSTVQALIDRYNIRIYDVPETDDANDFWAASLGDYEVAKDIDTSMLNYSSNNNDDETQSPPLLSSDGSPTSPPPAGKTFKLKAPSFPRRLSKLGKRLSGDKTKCMAESDAQLAETTSTGTAASETTTVDESQQGPDVSTVNEEDKDKDCNKQKGNCDEDKYGTDKQCQRDLPMSAASTCKSSVEEVPLRAKPAINFQDAVFYYPADRSPDDDDDGCRGLAHALSEGRVLAAGSTPAAACSSSDDRLPLKEAVSMQPGVGDDMPLTAGSTAASRRRPSMLRRISAFFGRSTGGRDQLSPAGRQLSAADASIMPPATWTESDEAPTTTTAVSGGFGCDDSSGAARVARSYTSQPGYFNAGESRASATSKGSATADDRRGLLMAEVAGGEQPPDVKASDDQLALQADSKPRHSYKKMVSGANQ